MELWQQIVLFLTQAVIVFMVVGGLVVLIAVSSHKASHKQSLRLERWDRRIKESARSLRNLLLSDKARKAAAKEEKRKAKSLENIDAKPACFVIDFKGDIKAAAAENLREEVTAILGAARPGDEVLVRVESPGGMVHGYGLAASQLQRIRKGRLHLTVAVDKVAASGGYLMACTADRIIAAPFAIVGSIGVIAQVPNFNSLLKKHDVTYKEYTAGEFKRTISLFGEITEKGEQKFVEQLEETHTLFKDFVSRSRPSLDMAKVATGEYWYGTRALELGLVDAIETSDDWLRSKADIGPVVSVKYQKKQPLNEKLSGVLGRALAQGVEGLLEKLESRRLI